MHSLQNLFFNVWHLENNDPKQRMVKPNRQITILPQNYLISRYSRFTIQTWSLKIWPWSYDWWWKFSWAQSKFKNHHYISQLRQIPEVVSRTFPIRWSLALSVGGTIATTRLRVTRANGHSTVFWASTASMSVELLINLLRNISSTFGKGPWWVKQCVSFVEWVILKSQFNTTMRLRQVLFWRLVAWFWSLPKSVN